MRFFATISVIALLSFAAAKAPPCDQSNDDLLAYQRDILKSVEASHLSDADWLKAVARPLNCLLQRQEAGTGMEKYYAGSLLRPLFGAREIDGLPDDPRFGKVAEILSRLTLKSDDIIKRSLITLFAKGEWGFYSPCDTKKDNRCPIFLPEEEHVKNQPPLIAASLMIHLKDAYFLLKGKEKQEVATRIKNLYRSIPENSPIKLQDIDEIYFEIFAPRVHLSLLS